MAFKWFEKAAEQDVTYAIYLLGECYYEGLGTVKDHQKAFEYFKKAAEQGYDAAEFWTGKCYYDGTGVEQNISLAFHWIEISANKGRSSARKFLNIHKDEYKTYCETTEK